MEDPYVMPAHDQFDQAPVLPQPASQAGPPILPDCRAARIADITDFAECLVKTRPDCPHRLAFSAFRYCVNPQREAIIARTLAGSLITHSRLLVTDRLPRFLVFAVPFHLSALPVAPHPSTKAPSPVQQRRPVTDAKEVGVGNAAEETFCHRAATLLSQSAAQVNAPFHLQHPQ